MKIVFICSEYPPAVAGGIGTFTRDLAEALADLGHEVHVVGHYDVPSTRFECARGVAVVRLSAAKGRKALLLDRFSLLRQLGRIVAMGPIHVIEAPDFEGPTAGQPRRSCVRIVRLHGSHRYFCDERSVRHSPSIAFMEKVALSQADAIVSVSGYTASRTRDLFGLSTEINTLHNAVNVPKHHQRKADYRERKRVVYFGTLAEKKGVLALADAWREFNRTHRDWRLTIIGRDSEHAGESVKASMLRLLGKSAASVEFTGYLPHDQVLSRLSTFDFAVLPSFSESFGLVALEAMGLGLPVIFSAMSSGPELIEHDADGWLCDPRSITSIVAAMAHAANCAEERERVGNNARATVEGKFSYEAFVARNVALYESLLSGQGHAK